MTTFAPRATFRARLGSPTGWIKRIGLVLLFNYALTSGLTASGIANARVQFYNLIGIAVLVTCWLLIRWRLRWAWHRTALNGVFVLWIIAFTVSLVANLDSWRRIEIGLWYVSAYIGLWYILQDALANRLITRKLLIESLLVGSVQVIYVGYQQLFHWLPDWFALARVSLSAAGLPEAQRLYSTLDNSNLLGAFLVVLIAFGISYVFAVPNRYWRVIVGVYTFLSALLLLLTVSRGAWVGTAAGLGVFSLLLLAHYDLLSVQHLRDWWRNLALSMRRILIGSGIVVILIGVSVTGLLIRSFESPGRSLALRTSIYGIALKMFTEKPLTGYGLFTFGSGLIRLESAPPQELHGHAHSIPFNVAAELGLIGLAALAVTVIVALRAMWQTWQERSPDRILLAGSIAATIGFGVHHLTDLAAMVTAIALSGLLTLALATASSKPPIAPHWQRNLQLALLIAGWIVLLLTGFHSNYSYTEYVAGLDQGLSISDYRGAAQRIQTAIDTDPGMPIYSMNQGFFLAVAAYNGDAESIQPAIEAYQRFSAIEPYYAPGWANQAALDWQHNQRDQAITLMRRASQLAPDSWQLTFNLATYEEATDDLAAARQDYQRTLDLYADASLYPEWQQSELRRSIADTNTNYSTFAQLVRALIANSPDDANQWWAKATTAERDTTRGRVIAEILALPQKDRVAAETDFIQARTTSSDPDYDAWVYIGKAYLASFDGDQAGADRELAAARKISTVTPFANAGDRVGAIAGAQYLRTSLPRYFIPQVYAPTVDPLVLLLLNSR